MILTVSLNEIDASTKKAARGAGLNWGLAEEAGRAVRWLARHDLPNIELIVPLLELITGKQAGEISPAIKPERWLAKAEILCPITTGAALSDNVELISTCNGLIIEGVSYPLLLLPFLAGATQSPWHYEISWQGFNGKILNNDLLIVAIEPDALFMAIANVKIKKFSEPVKDKTNRSQSFSTPVDLKLWRKLQDFSMKTYVPATLESRNRGAGAGTSDND